METAIINRKDSLVDEQTEILLLRFAVLFSAKVHLTAHSSLYFHKGFPATMPLKEKLTYLRMIVPVFDKSMTQASFDELVSRYFARKNMKNKQKSDLTLLMKIEKYFRNLESSFHNVQKRMLEDKGLTSLAGLNCQKDGNVIMAYQPLEENSEPATSDPIIIAILKIIGFTGILPLLDISIKDTSVYRPGFSLLSYDGRLMISPEPLFSVPDPSALSTSQLQIIRKSLTFFETVFYILTTLIERKEEFDYFGDMTLLKDFDQFITEMFQHAAAMQEIINMQEYICFLRSQGSSMPELKLHVGFCSNENLLKIYREQKVISDSMYLFIRDMMRGRVKPEACVPLLVVGRACESV